MEIPEEADEALAAPYPSKKPLVLSLVGAVLGALFAAQSTGDFMQFLDRQVHAVHCSFIPGATQELGESGCRTVMMSPYSSLFRESLWGGIPVSLWGLAVFAFLAYRAGNLVWKDRPTRAESRFLLAASALPVVVSVVFAFISFAKVGATCKVCVGIYLSSGLCFLGAWLNARGQTPLHTGVERPPFVRWFAEGVGFVAVLTATYVFAVPSAGLQSPNGKCGTLVQGQDPAGVLIPLRSGKGGVASIEVLDPLCPACKAFDARLSASALERRLDLKAVLFPLDSSCNWMVTESLHPGACAVSEAMLCAAEGDRSQAASREVLRWAFDHQEELRSLAARNEKDLRARIAQQFPKVQGCLGGYVVKNKLTKSLRWAVANAIPVLTPQLFVGELRMCDEDTDLGLEYTLSRMLSPETLARAHKPPRPVAASEPRTRTRPIEPAAPPPSPDRSKVTEENATDVSVEHAEGGNP